MKRLVLSTLAAAAFCCGTWSSALGATLYVNATTGSDSNSGTGEYYAKATIQAAVDAASEGDTILVAPGTYGIFDSPENKRITIRGTGGALQTIIDGNGTVNTEAGIMRLWADDGGSYVATNTVVEGFTIQNIARVDRGTLKRCIFRNNDTSSVGSGTVNAAVAENCLFVNNSGMNGAAGDGSIFKNCTMVGNRAYSGYTGVCLNSILENCIVYGNGNNQRQTWQYWFEQNPLVANVGYRERNVYVGDPGFVDAASGDYSLAEGSPCIDAGDNSYVTDSLDLAGNPRIANGTVDMGCYEWGSVDSFEGLVHRWSFNGDLTDSAGGQTATIVGNVIAGANEYTLAGGDNGSSYISLGSNVLPNDGTPVTIEIWATHLSSLMWSRMFTVMENFSNSPITGGSDEFSLCWDWDADVICRIAQWHIYQYLQDYYIGTQYHISAVFTPLDDGSWQIDFRKKDATTGQTLGSYTKIFLQSEWTLQIQPQTYCMLGHVNGDAAKDANASYNEVRIWNKAMTDEELTASVLAGPDVGLSGGSNPQGGDDPHGETPEFTFGGDANWVSQGNGVWQSGAISDNGSSYALSRVTGPGTISFDWKVSSESGYDKLHFYVDGTEVIDAISGEQDWIRVSYYISSSDSVELKWEYTKDVSASNGSDCGWIRNVVWTPGTSQGGDDNQEPIFTIENDVLVSVELNGATEITIPYTVTSIGYSAFENCSGLTSVTIPDGVTAIGSGAFWNCENLSCVNIPNSVEYIGNYAFYGCNEDLFDTNTIPGVLLVDGWAVGWNESIPANLDLEGVRGIGDWAFNSCTVLESVEIPGGLQTLGSGAFEGCSNLEMAVFAGNSPRIVYWSAFDGVSPDFVVYLPKGNNSYSTEETANGTIWIQWPVMFWSKVDPGITFGDVYRYHGILWGEEEFESSCYRSGALGYYAADDDEDDATHMFFVEVLGAFDSSDIDPIVENLGFGGDVDVDVLDDDEFFDFVTPYDSSPEEWNIVQSFVDYRETGDISGAPITDHEGDDVREDVMYEYEYDDGDEEMHFLWPIELWPDGEPVEGRYWIAVTVTAPDESIGRWSGVDGSFRIRQDGTDEVSSEMYVYYMSENAWPCTDNAEEASKLFRGMTINFPDDDEDEDIGFDFGNDVSEIWSCSYGTVANSYYIDTWENDPLEIELPEAGILYLDHHWFEVIENYRFNNVDSKEFMIVNASDDYDDWWDEFNENDVIRSEYFYQYGTSHDFPGVGQWKVGVNRAKIITIADKKGKGDIDFDHLQFFPSSSKAVAVEAHYLSYLGNAESHRIQNNIPYYMQGYVIGTGVYKVGETVTLTAVPAPGEEFDHWELRYGNFPTGIDTTQTTLSFTVTDACAGTAEERKQMVVRAVWKGGATGGDDDPLPEATSDERVEEILADAASDSLKENVTDVAEYSAFREWADRCGATHDAVKASPNAWLSFAINSPILIEKELTDDDISVESFAPTGTAGEFSLEVGIEDVEIGSAAAAERLAKLFGLEGSAELDEKLFSSDNVTLDIAETPVNDGNVCLKARPKVSGGRFFMRVRLKK